MPRGDPPMNPLVEWCSRHPRAMCFWLLMTAVNFTLEVLNALGVT